MTRLSSAKATPLVGMVAIPGDKSISHRALMFGSLAIGETKVTGLLEGEDVLATAEALRILGAKVTREEDGRWKVIGRGVGGFIEPHEVLNMGNAGTAARLMMGILASHPFTSFMTGDASLCSRPMERVMKPLREVGASFLTRSQGRLPLAITGAVDSLPTEYVLPVASAQVKSAVLLAGLNAPGETRVIEPTPCRDHTELMLRHFGANITVAKNEDGGRTITLKGQPELTAVDVNVPGDPSSAAFPIVAALLVPDSHVTLTNVGLNPLRTGLFQTLQEMGGNISIENQRIEAGEPVGDLVIKSSNLKGVEVPPERAPSMIDEYPVLAMAAACAEGQTRMTGLSELRVKESDRLAAIVNGLKACGVDVGSGEDWMTVNGKGKPPQGGAMIASQLDHRLAMSFLVLGMVSDEPVTIDDGSPINTSFPGFVDLMNNLGTKIS
ncbi:MAG: 3-phosphoshikimate 1-carboxyvinyltransferase [Rhodospirillales bacterium]|nr:3-phosphoshikimate 1-carboxyvinyltransferase [Rhodospirillales bacterium]